MHLSKTQNYLINAAKTALSSAIPIAKNYMHLTADGYSDSANDAEMAGQASTISGHEKQLQLLLKAIQTHVKNNTTKAISYPYGPAGDFAALLPKVQTTLNDLWSILADNKSAIRHDYLSSVAKSCCCLVLEILSILSTTGTLVEFPSTRRSACHFWKHYVRWTSIRYEIPDIHAWGKVFPLFVETAVSAKLSLFDDEAIRGLISAVLLSSANTHALPPHRLIELSAYIDTSISDWYLSQTDSTIKLCTFNAALTSTEYRIGSYFPFLDAPSVVPRCEYFSLSVLSAPPADADQNIAHQPQSVLSVRYFPAYPGKQFSGIETPRLDLESLHSKESRRSEVFYAHSYNHLVVAERQYREGIFSPQQTGYKCGTLIDDGDVNPKPILFIPRDTRTLTHAPGQLVGVRLISRSQTYALRIYVIDSVYQTRKHSCMELTLVGQSEMQLASLLIKNKKIPPQWIFSLRSSKYQDSHLPHRQCLIGNREMIDTLGMPDQLYLHETEELRPFRLRQHSDAGWSIVDIQ